MKNDTQATERAPDGSIPGLLFLCVANSARSQMAEALARLRAPGLEIWSAGTVPGVLNPNAVTAVSEVGGDLSSGLAKGLDSIPLGRVGRVVTLCAEESCPVFPGVVERLHWPLPDPAAVEGTPEEILASFRDVRDQISERLDALLGPWVEGD